jgi:histidine ammonia-lyase
MFWQGKRMPAREALAAAGLSPTFDLSAKDASCLINGSTVSLALAVLAIEDSRRILKAGDVALAMSLECLRGERAAFEARVHAARPHQGQASSARNVLRMIEGSKRCSEPARHVVFPDENRDPSKPPAPRVQDVYSLRCGPQVHGPVREAIRYVDGIIGVEINSATDNPLVFPTGRAATRSSPAAISTASTWRRRWTCSPSRWRTSARSASGASRASSIRR